MQSRSRLFKLFKKGQNFARDLGNCPPNICFPEYLAEQAHALAAEFPELLQVTVLEEQQLADLGHACFSCGKQRF